MTADGETPEPEVDAEDLWDAPYDVDATAMAAAEVRRRHEASPVECEDFEPATPDGADRVYCENCRVVLWGDD